MGFNRAIFSVILRIRFAETTPSSKHTSRNQSIAATKQLVQLWDTVETAVLCTAVLYCDVGFYLWLSCADNTQKALENQGFLFTKWLKSIKMF